MSRWERGDLLLDGTIVRCVVGVEKESFHLVGLFRYHRSFSGLSIGYIDRYGMHNYNSHFVDRFYLSDYNNCLRLQLHQLPQEMQDHYAAFKKKFLDTNLL
jgi:hypothetical protein